MLISSSTTNSAAIDSSSASMSADDLELLQRSVLMDIEPEMLLAGLHTAVLGNNSDIELSALLEHSEKWVLPLETNTQWRTQQFSLSEHGGGHFIYQETSKGPSSTSIEQSQLMNHCDEIGHIFDGNKSIERKGSVVRPSMVPIIASRSANDPLRQFDSSDNSEAMEDDEERHLGSNKKAPMSKNLVSERRRRKKLNERLYSLRALVPTISKMDKASIVSDAIGYVQDLQQQVEHIQADIVALQSNKDMLLEGSHDSSNINNALISSIATGRHMPEHKVIELDVSQMELHTYHLRIHCVKGPGVLVQLTRALEALDLEIVNANLTSVNDHILNTIVAKVKNDEILSTEELKRRALEIIPRFGLRI